MNCMKCGKKIADSAVFCENCLANMELHPVKPGTPVNLPNRSREEKKAPPKKRPTPEQRLKKAHTAIKWLVGILVVMSLLLAIVIAMLGTTIRERDTKTNIGQNYSAIED